MNPRRPRPWLWLALGALGVFGAVFFLAERFPHALAGEDSQIDLVRALAILALLAASLAVRPVRALFAARAALSWLALAAALVAGYAYRDRLAEFAAPVLGALVPQKPRALGDGAIEIRRSAGGHFHIEAEIRSRPDAVPARVRFLIDTGASDIVLAPEDARRAGFDLTALAYTRAYATANGRVMGAPVRLAALEIAGTRLDDVAASVNGAAMDQSLLGMAFLGRLAGFEITGDVLVLRWR